MRILLTNDDGWDAPGLAALKTLAAELGEVHVLAPRDPQSYMSHRVTTDQPMHLVETAASQFHLTGTPADCVRGCKIYPRGRDLGSSHQGSEDPDA